MPAAVPNPCGNCRSIPAVKAEVFWEYASEHRAVEFSVSSHEENGVSSTPTNKPDWLSLLLQGTYVQCNNRWELFLENCVHTRVNSFILRMICYVRLTCSAHLRPQCSDPSCRNKLLRLVQLIPRCVAGISSTKLENTNCIDVFAWHLSWVSLHPSTHKFAKRIVSE